MNTNDLILYIRLDKDGLFCIRSARYPLLVLLVAVLSMGSQINKMLRRTISELFIYFSEAKRNVNVGWTLNKNDLLSYGR